MPGRPCQICSDAANIRIAAEMIAEGASDQAIADQIGGISRMAVARHRQNHIETPARAVLAAVNKGREAQQEREQLVAAAEAGDVAAAFLSLERIAADLRRVQLRLERTADAAELDRHGHLVIQASAQTTRLAETRARLGQVGGYGTPRTEKSGGAPFVLNINFSGGHTTRIEGVPIHPDDPAFDAIPATPLPVADSGRGTIGVATDLGYSAADDDEAEFDEDV